MLVENYIKNPSQTLERLLTMYSNKAIAAGLNWVRYKTDTVTITVSYVKHITIDVMRRKYIGYVYSYFVNCTSPSSKRKSIARGRTGCMSDDIKCMLDNDSKDIRHEKTAKASVRRTHVASPDALIDLLGL